MGLTLFQIVNPAVLIPTFISVAGVFGSVSAIGFRSVPLRIRVEHFFLQEIPRMGSELCKLGGGLLLAFCAFGTTANPPEPFKGSKLGSYPWPGMWAAILLVVWVFLLYRSYRACYIATSTKPRSLYNKMERRRWRFAYVESFLYGFAAWAGAVILTVGEV